jgi:hypothetical protein
MATATSLLTPVVVALDTRCLASRTAVPFLPQFPHFPNHDNRPRCHRPCCHVVKQILPNNAWSRDFYLFLVELDRRHFFCKSPPPSSSPVDVYQYKLNKIHFCMSKSPLVTVLWYTVHRMSDLVPTSDPCRWIEIK